MYRRTQFLSHLHVLKGILANVTDIKSGEISNTVSFLAPAATKVTLYTGGSERVLTPDANGRYFFELASCGGAFVTVERDERAVLDSMEFKADSGAAVFDVQELFAKPYKKGRSFIYLNPTDMMTVDRAIKVTGGKRLVLVTEIR
jgi:hypothetical protein